MSGDDTGPWAPEVDLDLDELYQAWALIANARDWLLEDVQAKEWVEAATKWRDNVWHPALRRANA